MGVPKITSLYCLYNDNSGIFWKTQTHMIDAYSIKGEKDSWESNLIFLSVFWENSWFFLLYYHLLFPIRILKGCLVSLLTDINFHGCIRRKQWHSLRILTEKKTLIFECLHKHQIKHFLRRFCIKKLSFYCLGSTTFVINFATLHEWSSRYIRIRRWAASS